MREDDKYESMYHDYKKLSLPWYERETSHDHQGEQDAVSHRKTNSRRIATDYKKRYTEVAFMKLAHNGSRGHRQQMT